MKKLVYVMPLILLFSCSGLKPIERGLFVDERDGSTYKWVQFKTQTWMAQNLDFATPNSSYRNNDSTNHSLYGRFYKIDAARKACPVGWHLPSDEEWKILEMEAGLSKVEADNERYRGNIASDFVKMGSTEMNILFTKTLRYGTALGGEASKEAAEFWTSTNKNIPTYTRLFHKNEDRICRNIVGSAHDCNVRCVKD